MPKQPSILIDQYISQGAFAGAALVVAHNNQIVYEYYGGDAAPGLPASADVLWPLASISKVYSAAAIMKLVETGELPLSTLVSQVLPKFSGEGRELVRLRHLLTHTAGMIYESPEMEARLIAQTPLSDLIEEMVSAPLNFPPGTSIAYADYHYLLAGHVAAVVTGLPFHELVHNLVIKPMGLEQTWFPPPASLHPQIAKVRAVMAEGTDGAMYNSAYALGLAHPAFGVVASARDLARFAMHFAPGGPRIHSEATVRAMTTVQTGLVRGQPAIPALGSPGSIIPWGLGFSLQTEYTPGIFSELASFRSFGHGGASGCQLLVDPEANVVVALVSNTHARSGRETWYPRLQSIMNCALANVL